MLAAVGADRLAIQQGFLVHNGGRAAGRAGHFVLHRTVLLGCFVVLGVFQSRPYIIEEKCKKCGVCVESCPVEGKAVRFDNGRRNPPVYDYKKCIRCFCCQEMCPHQAIQVKKHRLSWGK